MDTCIQSSEYFARLDQLCASDGAFYPNGKKCGNTPSKRKYKNCWIRGFGMPEITNDYCSNDWGDFASMSVYGAQIGREEWERNNDIREYHIFMDGLNNA